MDSITDRIVDRIRQLETLKARLERDLYATSVAIAELQDTLNPPKPEPGDQDGS